METIQVDSEDDGAMTYSWVIAVILCVVAAIVSNLGTNLQKLAWTKRSRTRAQSVGGDSVTRTAMDSRFRRYWMIGFVCIVLGSLFDFAALGFGAQSVVAPLGSLTLVANMFFAQLLHGEVLSRRDVLATLVIISGCVFSVAFASHKNEIWTLDELMALYDTARFALYASCIITILFVGVLCIRYFERVAKVYGTKSQRYRSIFAFHRFSYSFLSGVAGAQSILFAKSLDELLVGSFNSDSRIFLAHMGSYLIVGAMLMSIFLQIYWINCALARWDALYVVPVFQAQWIIFSVIGGGVFYKEFDGFTMVQAMSFLFGILLTVLGVYVLSQRGAMEQALEMDGTSMRSTGSRSRSATGRRSRPGSVYSGTIERYLVQEGHDVEAPPPQPHSLAAQSLDSPLLDISTNSAVTYTPEPAQFEYEVVFDAAQIGLSVEPYALAVTVRDRHGKRKNRPPLKVWRVRANRNGSDHPVKVGHIIVAVNNEPVIGPHVRLPAVLEIIGNAPRPITLRFRGSIDHHTHTAALSEEEQTTRQEYSEDETDEDAFYARRRGTSTNLHGVALNPLLELIQTWDRNRPRAYDDMVLEEEELEAENVRTGQTAPQTLAPPSVAGRVGQDLGIDRVVDVVGNIEDESETRE